MSAVIEKLGFAYRQNKVLESISFCAAPGQLTAILGTNGAGKSTLLKCIDQILKPQTGSVFFNDVALGGMSRRELAKTIAYVEQYRHPVHARVMDSVLIGRLPHMGWEPTAHDLDIAFGALASLGMSSYAESYLDELSGGELQKIAIARALAQEPGLLLMDEPTSSLDLKNQLDVLELVKSIARQKSIAVIIAIHDLNLALRYADHFVLMHGGRVFDSGPMDIITPESVLAVYGVHVTMAEHCGCRIVIPR